MTIFVLLLVFISFLQNSLFNIDLVVLVLISRSFLVEDSTNYYFAFSLGLLNSLLQNSPLGVISIIYILAIKLTYLVRKIPFATRWFVVVPITFVVSLAQSGVSYFAYNTSFDFPAIVLQTGLVVVVYLLVRLWVDRIEVKNQTALSLGR